MSFKLVGRLLLVCLICAGAVAASRDDSESYDVVIVSGSAAGFAAALAAGRMGARVALIEDTPVPGGMLVNGVSNSDTFSAEALGGVFEEFRRRVDGYYAQHAPNDPVFRGPKHDAALFAAFDALHMDGRSHQWADPGLGGTWEPHVAVKILREMLAEVPSVRVFYNETFHDVIMQPDRLVGVVTQRADGSTKSYRGRVMIDATHEGDVAAKAGVPYRVGREARSPLEPHAGVIHFLDETGEIMPGSTGAGDAAIPSYGLRLTVKVFGDKDGPAERIAEPPDYRKSDYVAAGCMDKPWISMANGKFEMNANPVGNELQGINWGWPEAGIAERRRLYERYKNHALGFLYYQQHECGNTHLGLAKDEFTDNGNVPYRVYVREGRRIEGEYTMTEADINPFILGTGLIPPLQRDSIAVGHYPIDAKPVRPKTDFDNPNKSEGDFFLINASHAFQVPYRAIVPKKIDGLLVPVALSATHVAFSAIRMDPTWVAMGQAAGVAAVLSIRGEVPVRRVSVDQLQQTLLSQRARLFFYWDVALDQPGYDAIQWLSVREVIAGDDERNFRPAAPLTRAELARWVVNAFELSPSISNAHFADVSYRHPQFRAIETLFDNRLLDAFGVEPAWKKAGRFTPMRNVGFTQKTGVAGRFEPDRAVSWSELIETLHEAERRICATEPDAQKRVVGAMAPLAWAQFRTAHSPFAKPQTLPAAAGDLQRAVQRADAATLLAAANRPGSRTCGSKPGTLLFSATR